MTRLLHRYEQKEKYSKLSAYLLQPNDVSLILN